MRDAARPAGQPQLWRPTWPLLALAAALAAWLWPIGLGGQMPVGGDVTQFSIGLMAELHRALREGRLPLWNDLWGYGFPGLAESQMGVYYPPHVLLYGPFSTETAYTLSLVAHTLWGALGASWAARRFGCGPPGAALGALAWSACGFFIIHMPHQWGYTVGSWMPWAWGLAWPIARGEVRPRDGLLLAAVLALQVLPGHFQLAFITQVSVLGLALWGLFERPRGAPRALLGALTLAGAVAAVLPLAAAQLWPTFQLARLAGSRRGFDYLSGFAASPLHLVSYVAPGLFRSPLWRPLAWDPFHTSPEEHLAWIGLVPLFLALLALRRGWWHDPATRALSVLAAGSLLLSMGPFVPGFQTLIRFPGFSLFRAPARWAVATELALALLAGKGLCSLLEGDRQQADRAARRVLLAFLTLALLATAAVVGLAELAIRSVGRMPNEPLPRLLQSWASYLPWDDDPLLGVSLLRLLHPPRDPLIIQGLLRRGEAPGPARLIPSRAALYREELAPTALALLALAIVGGSRRFARHRAAWLAALAALELIALGHRLRPIETGPMRPLTEQSPVLHWMAARPRGTRIIDGHGNLPIVAGAAAVRAYRTLDRPIMAGLTQRAAGMPGPATLAAWLPAGIQARVWPTSEVEQSRNSGAPRTPVRWWGREPDVLEDPELARWTLGRKGLDLLGPRAASFTAWDPFPDAPRAWFLPMPEPERQARFLVATDSVIDLERWLRGARPLRWRPRDPEHFEIGLTASEPGFLLVSQLHDPEWQAVLIGPRGSQTVEVLTLFQNHRKDGWMGVRVPSAGAWKVRWTYRGRAAAQGMGVSAVAWAGWLALWVGACWIRGLRPQAKEPT